MRYPHISPVPRPPTRPLDRFGLAQSLGRGLVGLEMAFDGGVRPTDLAARLGVDRTTAYRLLQTLTAHGYLVHEPVTRRYRPNAGKFLALARQLAAAHDWPAIAFEHLRRLRDLTGETANLAVLHEGEVVFIGHQPAMDTPTILQPLGARRPAHASALGKALLAHLAPAELDRIVAERGLPALTARTLTAPATLREHLRAVRQRGYAVDDEETLEGVRCVAAPLFGPLDQVVAALGLTAPSSRLTVNRLPEAAQSVMDLARAASLAMGAQAILPVPANEH